MTVLTYYGGMNSQHQHLSGAPQARPDAHSQSQVRHQSYPAPSAPHVAQPQWTNPPQQNLSLKPHREIENLLLNLALYLGSLFIVASSGLLVYTVAPRALQLSLLGLLTLLLFTAGISTYRWVPKLRLASYTFAGTGLALLPLLGLTIYHSYWPYSGASLWLLISLVGSLAVIGALALMQARVMSYLVIAFIVSDVLAFNHTVQIGMLWFFVSLIGLATLLSVFVRAFGQKLPLAVSQGFFDSSRVFVPATVGASLLLPSLEAWEVALISLLASCYVLAHLFQEPTWFYYLQVRLYPALTVLYLSLWLMPLTENPTYSFLPVTLFLFASALWITRGSGHSVPWSPYQDALATWALAQLGLFAFAFSGMTQAMLKPTVVGSTWYFTLAESLLTLALLVSLGVLVLILQGSRLITYLPLFALAYGGLGFFTLPIMAQAFNLIALAGILLWSRPQQNPQNLYLTGLFALSALPVLGLALITPHNTYLATLSYGLVSSLYLLSDSWRVQPELPSSRSTLQGYVSLGYLLASVAGNTALALGMGTGLVGSSHPRPLDFLILGLLTLFTAATTSAVLTLINRYQQIDSSPILKTFAYTGVGISAVIVTSMVSSVYAYVVLAGYIVGSLVPIRWIAHPIVSHSFLLIRGFIVLAAVKTLFTSQLEPDTATVVFVLLCALLAGTSLYLAHHRPLSSHPKAELTVGITFTWISAVANLLLTDYVWNWRPLLTTLVLLALFLAWLGVTAQPAVRSAQGALLVASIVPTGHMLLVAGMELGTPTLNLILGSALIAIPNILALWLGSSEETPHQIIPGAGLTLQKRWEAQRHRPMIFPGLIAGSFLLFFSVLAPDQLGVSLLAILVFTGGWLITVKAPARPPVVIVGGGFLLLRACLELSYSQAFFYMVQYLVVALAVLSIFKRVMGRPLPDGLPPQAYRAHVYRGFIPYWSAFALQAAGSLVFLPFADYLIDLPEKIVLLLATAVLLTASAFLSRKTPVPITALLLTYQFLLLLAGFNFTTFFILGISLIGVVTWRLLVRDEDPVQPPPSPSSYPHMPLPQQPLPPHPDATGQAHQFNPGFPRQQPPVTHQEQAPAQLPPQKKAPWA